MECAPKDGQWIIGFTGQEELYVVMRWWDGTMHDDYDDLTCDEGKGEWVGGDDVHRHFNEITHWCAFEPHPQAPPKTTSFGTFDAKNGTISVPRAERGITERDIRHSRTWHQFAEELQDNNEPVDYDELNGFVEAYLDAEDELARREALHPEECPKKLWEDILDERGIDDLGRPVGLESLVQ